MQLVTEMRSVDNRIKNNMDIIWLGKSKAKVHFVTHHEGQTGEWMYSSTVSLTSALDWGVGGQCHPLLLPRPIYTRKRNQVHFVQEAVLAPGPVWRGAKNFAPPPGFDLWTFHSEASRYTSYAVPALTWVGIWRKKRRCRWMHGDWVKRIM
jgi:hypothetical protein